ncbi:hypothetical protein BJX66DRAFT_11520 [Aspergillus keveii]|uniref:Uncharacterized protein n=1 Tax=Aspergillus keveii TaxID=714993 RepID=A0ABR4GQS0_9EURO
METEKKRPDQGRGKRKDLASRAARCAGERNHARYIKSRGAGRGPLPEGNSFLIDQVHIVIVSCFWTAPLQSTSLFSFILHHSPSFSVPFPPEIPLISHSLINSPVCLVPIDRPAAFLLSLSVPKPGYFLAPSLYTYSSAGKRLSPKLPRSLPEPLDPSPLSCQS